jgi:hypothetical protein
VSIQQNTLSQGTYNASIILSLVGMHRKRLACQQRKAESFTVTRLHCGSARMGYQPSEDYGDRDSKGISLGTAMSISGAAASPNMGYHSSPLVTLLMTLFNALVRLVAGKSRLPGRRTVEGARAEIGASVINFRSLGPHRRRKPYVYLSDGGHFENLALYEMILRRCDTIVVVDAGADPDYQFEDLANALRKCRVDLGVTIHFDKPLDMRKGIERQRALRDRPYRIQLHRRNQCEERHANLLEVRARKHVVRRSGPIPFRSRRLSAAADVGSIL